ncbi:MAG: polysaccharide biosynthesis protein [Bacillota bacterium]|nr:polysaccharide biosynthesis protein [Bacillota bacterium]
MRPVNQSKDLFRGAFILTIAALIIKILSAVYRIPFQNIVGDVGFYIYQQIYPFYGLAVVLTTTGFPVVISKVYAELKEKGNGINAEKFLLTSYIFLQLFGIVCFLVLYTGSGQIAIWMNDPKLVILLKVVSFVFLLFPFVSVIRGFYQGKGDMVPTAVSQVIEQMMRVATILLLSFYFTKKGSSPYFVGGAAMFGSITGSLVSAIILFTFLFIRKEWKMFSQSIKRIGEPSIGSKWILNVLFSQGLAICICGMLMIFIQMADSLNLYSLLVSGGVNAEAAKGLKGVFDRGQPLIQLGTVVGTSMSLSLVPLISSERLKKNSEFLFHKINLTMKISVVFGVGATAGLMTIIEPTNIMLFKNASGSSMLGVLCFVILLNTLISTIVAIMQGMGKIGFPAGVTIMAFPIKYGLNLILVPHFKTMGAALSTVITLTFICLLLVFKFKKMFSHPIFTATFFKHVFMATMVMILLLKGVLITTHFLNTGVPSGRLIASFEAIGSVCIGGIAFLWIVLRGGIFPEEDLALFPFGSKLALFLRREDRSSTYVKKN